MKDKNVSKMKRKRVTFNAHAEPGSTVFVAGCFNNWSPNAKPLQDKNSDGRFTGTMYLAPGLYEYKYVINGVWCVDANCPEWTKNAIGTLNSVLRVEG